MRTKPLAGVLRTVNRGTAYAVVFLFILSALLSGAAYLFAVRAVRSDIGSRASVVQLCQAGNESRAQQLSLWTHIVEISSAPPHQTPAQAARRKALISAFLAYVRTSFAPRDCQGTFGG